MEHDENWKVMLQFMPEDWEEKAKDLGAITRQRNIKSAEILLRILLIHLADGCSLREAVVRAKEGNLANISDVALLKRLRASSKWLNWIAQNMLVRMGGIVKKPDWLDKYNVRILDASVITEPGSTGTDWRLHFSIELFGLKCDHMNVTNPKIGESLTNYFIRKGDLVIGDRAYGNKVGISHVLDNEGDFLVRIKSKAMTILTPENKEFKILKAFEKLGIGEIGDWDVFYRQSKDKCTKIRLCAIKKSPENAEYSIKKAMQEMSKKQKSLSKDTLELHKYFFVITSVSREDLSAKQIMELYRLRWQVELAFKRLKSILGLGHLPKIDPESAKAWMHGKLAVAMLAALIIDEGHRFSPWGYPLYR